MRLIDADALNDVMYHEAFENNESYNEKNPMAKWDSGLWIRYKMFENAIDDAPTIEPKRGEWIPVKASIYPYGNDVKCSVCGHRMGSSFGYNFCPMCGADMREREGE